MAFTINKLGRNFKRFTKPSETQLHFCREVGRRLQEDVKTVMKVVEQFRESGSTAQKPFEPHQDSLS